MDRLAEHARKNMNATLPASQAADWSAACALHRVAAALERLADQGEPLRYEAQTPALEKVAQTPGAEPREGGEG